MALDAGELHFTLEYARGLKDEDWFGRQDPYCIIKCGAQQYRSRTHIDGGKNPVFAETFRFNIINENTVEITVYDEDTVVRDDFIGMASVTLARVRQMGHDSQHVPVISRRKGKQHGELVVSLKFIPNRALMHPYGQAPVPYAPPMPMAPPAAYYPPPAAPVYAAAPAYPAPYPPQPAPVVYAAPPAPMPAYPAAAAYLAAPAYPAPYPPQPAPVAYPPPPAAVQPSYSYSYPTPPPAYGYPPAATAPYSFTAPPPVAAAYPGGVAPAYPYAGYAGRSVA